MPSLTYLTFTLNDLPSVLPNLERLAAVVDESVVVDSSHPDHVRRWEGEVTRRGGRIVRVLPLCASDLLRPFAIAHVRSERVIELDSDEEPSPGLVDRLRHPGERDAYVVPRYEIQLRAFTAHLRLYRPATLRFVGPSCAFPQVEGSLGALHRNEHILHHANYQGYFAERGRPERYLFLEAIQRPYTREYLQEAATVRLEKRRIVPFWLERLLGDLDVPLGDAGIELGLLLRFVQDALLRGGWQWARFQRRYELAKRAYIGALDPADRAAQYRLATEIRRAGGLIQYLRLTDVDRLARLTSEFDWTHSGPEVLQRLLAERQKVGS